MREDICSIPVNDVFMPKDGCPFCRMRDMLEDRMATYITGAAMMEPDVRVETNRLGFCTEHFNQILARGSRLSVALILESLLATVKDEVFPQVMEAAMKMPKKNFQVFQQETDRLAKKYLEELNGDVTHFCRMFDYRNAGGDWGNSKDAIERAIQYLTARVPEDRQKSDEKNRAF